MTFLKLLQKQKKRQTVYRIVNGFKTGFFGLNKSYLSTARYLSSALVLSE